MFIPVPIPNLIIWKSSKNRNYEVHLNLSPAAFFPSWHHICAKAFSDSPPQTIQIQLSPQYIKMFDCKQKILSRINHHCSCIRIDHVWGIFKNILNKLEHGSKHLFVVHMKYTHSQIIVLFTEFLCASFCIFTCSPADYQLAKSSSLLKFKNIRTGCHQDQTWIRDA